MYGVHDWAEVHRLVRAGKTNTDIARAGMSRNTVARLRGLANPPTYERPAAGSLFNDRKDGYQRTSYLPGGARAGTLTEASS